MRRCTFVGLAMIACAAAAALAPRAAAAAQCARTVMADVVAIDQPLIFNRYGAQNVNGNVYALRRDVVDVQSGLPLGRGGAATPGKVALRPDKRPRPLVLRMAVGDCLQVKFQNLLSPQMNPRTAPTRVSNLDFRVQIDDQVAARFAGFHPQGLELVNGISDDSSYVGKNESSLVPPGGSATYTFYARKEGGFLVTSGGAPFGGEGTQGQSSTGLFGAVNVEPPRASFYRSQVTDEELRLATRRGADGAPLATPGGQPVLDYEATYPAEEPWLSEGKAGLPVLDMLTAANELVHTDLNAMIVGPNVDGSFPKETYPLESVGLRNPTVPNRLEPFREFTTIFHDEVAAAQAFPGYFGDVVFSHTLHGVRDSFMINYGSGGIGTEIIANRLGVGPAHDCVDCAYEEFFLTAYAVGDPAMVVDRPANMGLESIGPGQAPGDRAGPKATAAFFPDDPSNVHHSYTNDFVKFRNLHVGKEQHVFHLHNHQWLFNPNDDDANYIDAQGLGPGSSYTYEINFGGSGNRNKTTGDAIFHCHFYPHFAMGMWELWRIHDVLETGTVLAASGGTAEAPGLHTVPFALQDGTPALDHVEEVQGRDASGAPVVERLEHRARSLPDGEIVVGTPIPALVPLPGKAIAPVPGKVTVVAKREKVLAARAHPLSPAVGQPQAAVPAGSNASVIERDRHPGFPFFIAGVEHTVGQRPTTPPLDMLSEVQAAALQAGTNPLFGGRTDLVAGAGGWDGGLPRHALHGHARGGEAHGTVTRLDFSKEIVKAAPEWFPEEGTDLEQVAMAYHAIRNHPSTKVLKDGTTAPADFVTNGSPPSPSAPYHEPCVDDLGTKLTAGVTGHFFDPHGGTGYTGSSPYTAENPRTYKAAAIQIDAVFNKAGYHFPQERITALWEDVLPTINKEKAPEPFVIRFNTFDCGKYLHTNLVPPAYELDDYQVRTPTDIIGQHIHLPKWDLTTTDGSANGWNYEDGTLSPGAVRERIHAINAWNAENPGGPVPTLDGRVFLEPAPHPFFGAGQGGEWLGARTTIQRWFFDPVINAHEIDRGLGIIFTHDHFGPSSHQQIGLYASVLTEPAGSAWVHNETGDPLNVRADGGPTTWQAAILTGQHPGYASSGSPNLSDLDGDGKNDSFREFWFQMSDFQHAYEAGTYVGAGPDGRPDPAAYPATADTFRHAIMPSVREANEDRLFPELVEHLPVCPPRFSGIPRPCPEAISVSDPGMLVVNYRNEPVSLRVYDPSKPGPDGKPGAQADGLAGDLAFALQTRTDRKIAELNTVLGNTPYPALTNDLAPGDPFTPMMRAYVGDMVRVKVQVGGHEEEHHTTIHGLKWLQGGSGHGFAKNSGWRNTQAQGISEQFTFAAPIVYDPKTVDGIKADYAYSMNPSQDGWWSGEWGLLRTYQTPRPDLVRLPNDVLPLDVQNGKEFKEMCPVTAPVRRYDVTAVLANDVLPPVPGVKIVPDDPLAATQHVGGALNPAGGTLVYNPRATAIAEVRVPRRNPLDPPFVTGGHAGPLHDPTAMMLVRTADLGADGKLKPGVPVEPLVLRAVAGECVEVTLRNKLPRVAPDLANTTYLAGYVNRDRSAEHGGVTTFGNNLIRPSSHVGLHTQLVAYDVTKADGTNVGQNPVQTVPPNGVKTYRFYAGDVRFDMMALPDRAKGDTGLPVGKLVATPVEFGGANLIPADKVKQGQKSLVGTLVVLPEGATFAEDAGKRAAATVTDPVNGTFRDFATVLTKQLSARYADGWPVESVGGVTEGGVQEDSQDAGSTAINYGTEPLWFRFRLPPNADFGRAGGSFGAIADAHLAFSNALAGGTDPVTPVFTVPRGTPFRMHVVEPHGGFRGSSFNLHGHVWQRDPYVCPGSADLGLPGKCSHHETGSRALGDNPIGMSLGGQESLQPYTHFEFVFPSAGGTHAVPGDYLFRDTAGFGVTQGLWGILRVQ